MKSLPIVLLIIIAFVLGWWLNEMNHFAKGVKYNAMTKDSLRRADTTHLVPINYSSSSIRMPSDTFFVDSNELVIRDSNCYISVLRKFIPKKRYEDFPVSEKFSGDIPALNFSTCAYGKRFKTVTTEGAKEGAVFAGHYGFAKWGCGTGCQACSIIDLKNGKVYAGPTASCGFDFKLNSKILFINPTNSSGWYNWMWGCYPEEYVWIGNKFKKLE